MTLTSGARIGPYEIQSALGKGGMGEVYRALDTRLGRPVAIKVLTAHIESEPVGRLRFDQEALTVSSLSHPHICALYDIGEENGVRFLVMEYIEGETLASRLRRGSIPIDQVLRYAIEIADAIDHAHRRGFVHRDLKPSNIMLTRSGAKVLDFGIAKRWAPAVIDNGRMEAQPPTTTLTAEGTILGTLNYMAPEQLQEADTDARADIFAFGAVVYEMATKRQAFEGPSRASVIAAILEREPPPIIALQPVAPPLLDHVIARCLAKDPDERWQTARDVKQELKWIAERGAAIGSEPASAVRDKRRRRATWLAAGILVGIATLATLVPVILASRPPPEDSRPYRFVVPPPENATFSQSQAFMALSPDGHSLAYVASRQGKSRLWVQSFDSAPARELPDTDGAAQAFWSPDSRFIAFSAEGKLKKIDVSNGSSQVLADQPANNGDWSRDGVIVVSKPDPEGAGESSLFRLPASGGSMTPVTALDRAHGEIRHSWPHFLPDGRHFFYLAKSTQPDYDEILYVGSLDSNDKTMVRHADSQAVYVPSGYLVFLQGNSLVAQRFDERRMRVTGEPLLIADGPIERNSGSGRGAFTVSPGSGVLAYRTLAETQLTWVARSGRPLGSIGAAALYGNPALSPDEHHVAVDRLDRGTGKRDIWLIDLANGVSSPFTSEGLDAMPLWFAEDSIVFRSRSSLKMKAASGARGDELLLADGAHLGAPLAWLRDGSLLYDVLDPRTRMDLRILPAAGGRRPVPLLAKAFNEDQGQLSPDERWIAYVSDESRQKEVWVQPFRAAGDPVRVSTNGGVEPRWRSDGKELFYLATSDRTGGFTTLMAVAMKADSRIEAGRPEPLFETRMLALTNSWYTRNQYVVSGDGQRFLINQPPAGTPLSPITVMLNWSAALR